MQVFGFLTCGYEEGVGMTLTWFREELPWASLK